MKVIFILITGFLFTGFSTEAQTNLLTNIASRKAINLNGAWQYIIDPYETGFYNYRWQERNENDREAYWSTDVPQNKTERLEHGYSPNDVLKVPGDWNSQHPQLQYYEGTVWYKKSFDAALPKNNERVFLHFGAVNYRADVYLNGKKLGVHKGGFTPFNFEVSISILKEQDNYLVVKVDNKRYKDEIPTLNTDWWNYGGITRDVNLVYVPATFIKDYSIQLSKGAYAHKEKQIEGWIKFNQSMHDEIEIGLPGLNFKKKLRINGDSIAFQCAVPGLQLWSPTQPTLYKVAIVSPTDTVEESIGFRNIEVKDKNMLLNGQSIFLRGICIHEELPEEARRAYSKADALKLLTQAKSLNVNMVRLAHYPHNENMTRVSDSMGIMVWSEIPVYWTIDFSNSEVLQKAKMQLNEMIKRDRNRASIIIWSVGNETPVNEARTSFMSDLVATAKKLDSSRLVTAALEVHNVNGVNTIDDPLGKYTDIISVNEYLGWYGGLPSDCAKAKWEVKYNKPLFFSETGAEALGGFHADSLTRWSEEYQAWYYREQVAMMKRMPDNFTGLSPWILNDFRSPRRNNPVYQQGWNNKGLYDHTGKKKQAFYVLKAYYDLLEKEKQN